MSSDHAAADAAANATAEAEISNMSCSVGRLLLTDVDECVSERLHNCSSGLSCVNTPGSFVCECSPGSAYNPETDVCQGTVTVMNHVV